MGFAMIDFELFWQSMPALFRGALITIEVSILTTLLGLSLGITLGFAQSFGNKIVKIFVGAYVNLIRGTPMLLQIFFVFYILPQFGVSINAFWSAVLAIGINSSAYISQTIRSGISAIPQGQIDAAQTMGMSKIQTILYIVLPQVIKIAMPALSNEFITLIKDSSLASIIGVVELTKEGSIIRSRTYDALTVMCAVGLIYLIITLSLSYILENFNKYVTSKKNI